MTRNDGPCRNFGLYFRGTDVAMVKPVGPSKTRERARIAEP